VTPRVTFDEQLGHDVTLLRKALPGDSSDEAVLRFAHQAGCILLICNRDDFLHLAATRPHHGVVIVIRRRTRGEERMALFRPLERAGETASETTSTSPDRRRYADIQVGGLFGRLRPRGCQMSATRVIRTCDGSALRIRLTAPLYHTLLHKCSKMFDSGDSLWRLK
jgi:hypothetical protein